MATQAQKNKLMVVLEALGGSSGNGSLREELGWAESTYTRVRDALIDEGLVEKGRGRGGSVSIIENQEGTSLQDIDEEEIDDLDDEDADGDVFSLSSQEETPTKKPKAGAKTKVRKKSKSSSEKAQIVSYRHGETRANNPEVGMVHAENDPDQPKTVWAYDPHIDPALMFDSARGAIENLIDDALMSGDAETMRDALEELRRMQAPYLNWTGKAERTSFEVDTVSLHVHERVDPATILANARKRLKGDRAEEVWRQASLFAAPFENLPLRQALDFYHHEKGWSNRLIAGDSLLVMNSLLKKEAMAGEVQMIYIDPPYGIKYGSNFQPFTNKRDVKDGSDADLTQEPEMIKAFRDTWELGIHSYLTYLRDRLILAKDLLHNEGSVFVQISDENLHYVREIMDEIFKAKNFVGIIAFRKTTGQAGNFLPDTNDYIVWYSKDKSAAKFFNLYQERVGFEWVNYDFIRDEVGQHRKMTKTERAAPEDLDEECLIYRRSPLTSASSSESTLVEFEAFKSVFSPGKGGWKTNAEGLKKLLQAGRLESYGSTLSFRRYANDFPFFPYSNSWTDTASGGYGADKVYVVQTSTKVVERCLLMTTEPGDLVLDPTCGSGTTAYVAEKWGRRWISCDTSRVAITLAKQRLMTASFDYYKLRYPHEGLKGAFDYKTVPHITLKSIANNPDINTIYDENSPKVEAELKRLNLALAAKPPKSHKSSHGARKGKFVDFAKGGSLFEWEVPYVWPLEWPGVAREPFDAYHRERQTLQNHIDRSISDHAEQETLYDKPEVDNGRLRITGPFSIEAVPAPSVVSLDESQSPDEADSSIARSGETSRQSLWRDELMKTGIRAKGGAILKIAELEAIPGCKYLHASGQVADSGDRITVSFGPEYAALEQKQVERAIEEAQTLVPRPKIVVFCAFTFDPEAAKDIDELNWPGVALLKAQMNTDLLTDDLKKARSSNQSFWLMGQPDVELQRVGDLWQVEVNGFDYFDPREGELVSGGKSKIAMWSLDTDYDGRSLMPHQVFFPMAGAKDGWNRLKKTIRAELDEDLLEQFHGTVSLPFEAGDNARVAIKIVDDRGIESLKILPLE